MRSINLTLMALGVMAGLVLGAGPGQAYEEKPFETAAFKAAQSAGQPILVDVFAPWCPTCAAQQKVLGPLKQNPAYDKLTLFRVDYDNQPDVLKSLGVRQQSTLIAYKGAKETGRTVGDTSASGIEALLNTTLK
jgi:thioredoxin 1